jgi:hypothetical protein
MTLDNLANLAEVLASIGVLITLIFLVMQIRDNTKAPRIEALSAFYADGNQVAAQGSGVPEIAAAAYKTFTRKPLDEMDKYYLSNWVLQTCGVMERSLVLTQEGILDEAAFERASRRPKSLLSTPAGRQAFERLAQDGLFGHELREYMADFYAELDGRVPRAIQANHVG